MPSSQKNPSRRKCENHENNLNIICLKPLLHVIDFPNLSCNWGGSYISKLKFEVLRGFNLSWKQATIRERKRSTGEIFGEEQTALTLLRIPVRHVKEAFVAIRFDNGRSPVTTTFRRGAAEVSRYDRPPNSRNGAESQKCREALRRQPPSQWKSSHYLKCRHHGTNGQPDDLVFHWRRAGKRRRC